MTSRLWGTYRFLIPLLALPAYPQAVISARSGLVHFAEGSVFLDDQKIEQTFGRFAQMKDGSELRTEEGRAEVILAPDVFVRLGENSAIRMLSSLLQDTRVELLTGSVVVESQNAATYNPVTMLWSGYQIQLRDPGRYRIDSSPAQLKVDNGMAEVFHGGISAVVKTGYALPFSGDFVARKPFDQRADGLDGWNSARNNSISENNAQTGQATDLSAAMEGWQNDPNAFLGALGTPGYFPPLGYAPLSGYGVQAPYYPGLNSPFMGLWGIGGLSPLLVYPRPVVGYFPYSYSPSIGLGTSAFPRRGTLGAGPYNRSPITVRPIAPVHSAVGAGHIGGRR